MTMTYKQERVGSYIVVNSGKRFYALAPRPEDITISDIAHSLSNICRFTGHGDRFYSVGEHSILCARVAKVLGYSTLQQLYCLIHDGSESVINDLARPVKQNIPQYMDIEDNIMKVIWKVFGVPEPTEDDYKAIKKVDNTLLVNEMTQLINASKEDIPTDIDYDKIHVNLSYGYSAGASKVPFIELYNHLIEKYQQEVNSERT